MAFATVKKRLVLVACLVISVVFYTHGPIGVLKPGYQNFFMALDRLPKVTDVPQAGPHKSEPAEPKLILFWTSYFDLKDFKVGRGQEPFLRANCSFIDCLTTSDRSKFNQSHAVIFHSRNIDVEDLPRYRLAHQRFIFFNYESPPNSGLSRWKQLENFFNWTMTYRRDSDVVSREPYGIMRPRRNFTQVSASASMDVSRKNRSVAWFVSHCQTPSQREWFVDALSRHIDVDVYGNCGGLNCDAEGRCPRASYDLLRDHYRFYLSFENSLCTDYVTEKLFRPMTYDVVPIVYGGADYAQYLPEHSFINIRDFRSPQSLAQHLHQLMADDEQYLKYFEWRTKYEIVERPRDGWCDLCRFLHDDSLPAKSYEDIVEWWAGRTCLATPTFWGQPPRTVFSFSKVNMVKVLQKLLSSQ